MRETGLDATKEMRGDFDPLGDHVYANGAQVGEEGAGFSTNGEKLRGFSSRQSALGCGWARTLPHMTGSLSSVGGDEKPESGVEELPGGAEPHFNRASMAVVLSAAEAVLSTAVSR